MTEIGRAARVTQADSYSLVPAMWSRDLISASTWIQRRTHLLALALSPVILAEQVGAQAPPPLINLARIGSVSEVEAALRTGAVVNLADVSGVTALHIASAACRPEVVAVLLSARADKDRQARDGSTALMFAALQGCQPVIEQLVNAGAKADTLNQRGETAHSIARARGYSNLESLLAVKDGLTDEARAGLRGSCSAFVEYLDALGNRTLARPVRVENRRIDSPTLTFGSEQPAAFLLDSETIELLFRQQTPAMLEQALAACALMNPGRWLSESEVGTATGATLGFLSVRSTTRIYDDVRQEWVRGQSVLHVSFERPITR